MEQNAILAKKTAFFLINTKKPAPLRRRL